MRRRARKSGAPLRQNVAEEVGVVSVDHVTYHDQLCLSGLVVAIGRSVNVKVSITQQLVCPCEFDRASAEPLVNHRPTAAIEQLQAHRKHWRFIILTGQHLPRMRKV